VGDYLAKFLTPCLDVAKSYFPVPYVEGAIDGHAVAEQVESASVEA
jgi:hypothetical protein